MGKQGWLILEDYTRRPSLTHEFSHFCLAEEEIEEALARSDAHEEKKHGREFQQHCYPPRTTCPSICKLSASPSPTVVWPLSLSLPLSKQLCTINKSAHVYSSSTVPLPHCGEFPQVFSSSIQAGRRYRGENIHLAAPLTARRRCRSFSVIVVLPSRLRGTRAKTRLRRTVGDFGNEYFFRRSTLEVETLLRGTHERLCRGCSRHRQA